MLPKRLLVRIMKMRSIFVAAILAATIAAVLFLGSDAQELMQSHHTERISGAGAGLLLVLLFISCFILTRCLQCASARSKSSIQ